MSGDGENEALRHIVIVRRKRGDHDDHHGGAWKIAYADFMTAMMAFFLVMWLVNMTDDKKIVQIAAYFNPLRLTDKSPSQKGLQDAAKEGLPQLINSETEKGQGGSGKGKDKDKENDKGKDNAQGPKDKSKAEAIREQRSKTKSAHVESELFVDPLQAIAKIADKAPPTPPSAGAGTMPWGHPSAVSGKALLDPFDPAQRGRNAMPPSAHTLSIDKNKSAVPDALKREQGALDQQASRKSADALASKTSPVLPDPATEAAPTLESEIKAALKDVIGPQPQVAVKVTPEGILIRLADDVDFGMFAIASAEPLPATVQFMDRIGAILKERAGPIVVRGHTDGRPYRSGAYDNWRLSSARAHMAQYMLLRAGVATERIIRVEGHADRNLLDTMDKEAAQNRRIEILLGGAGP
ncbi:MAG: flagellar motor protein MotB [Hyphomicrobium sp.]